MEGIFLIFWLGVNNNVNTICICISFLALSQKRCKYFLLVASQ